MWIKTKIEKPTDGKEVLLSDGKVIYLGTYCVDINAFVNQNNFCIPGQHKYWRPLPELP